MSNAGIRLYLGYNQVLTHCMLTRSDEQCTDLPLSPCSSLSLRPAVGHIINLYWKKVV